MSKIDPLDKFTILILVIFFILFLVFTCFASTPYKDLSYRQLAVLKIAYMQGKPHDLGYTLAAVCWQESDCGKYNINLADPSSGWYHVYIPTAMKYLHIKNTRYNRNRVAQWLIDDPQLAGEIALYELKRWLQYHKGSWRKAVSSYNGGFKGNKVYRREIIKKVKILQRNF